MEREAAQTPTTHHTQPLPTTTRTKNRNQTTRPTTPKRCKAAPTTAGHSGAGRPSFARSPRLRAQGPRPPNTTSCEPQRLDPLEGGGGRPLAPPLCGPPQPPADPLRPSRRPHAARPRWRKVGEGVESAPSAAPAAECGGPSTCRLASGAAFPGAAIRIGAGEHASGQETTHWGRRIGYPNDLLPTPMTRCPPQCGHASADMAPPSPSRERTTTAPPLRDARMAATPCAPSPGPWPPPRSGAGWKPVAVSMAPTPQRRGLEAGRSVSRCRGGRPSAAPGPR